MKQVYERVLVGAERACDLPRQQSRIAMVHACKTPCHQRAVGYTGSLKGGHPNYLALQRNGDLYLNLVDPPIPLFKLESFHTFLDYAAEQYARGCSLVIHCNQGESRAPSLALLFLAKRLGVIGNGSYGRAREDFEYLYPSYNPGRGIETFLTTHWQEL